MITDIQHLTYLAVDLIILLPFLLKIRDRRLRFGQHRRSIVVATAVVLIAFAVWDVFATRAGVWAFNPDYVIGIEFMHLPLEEILFFVSVCVTSILVWEATGYWGGRK